MEEFAFLHDAAQISPLQPPALIKHVQLPQAVDLKALLLLHEVYCHAEKKERGEDKRIPVEMKKARRLICTQMMHNATILIIWTILPKATATDLQTFLL